MNWIEAKEEVVANIEKANIENKKAIKAILNFERRINTSRNLLMNGMQWQTVLESNSSSQAYDLLENKLADRSYCEAGEFSEDYAKYCEAAGYCVTSDLGDFLC